MRNFIKAENIPKNKSHVGLCGKEKKSVSKTGCNNYCNRELKKEYEWLKEADKFALTNAIYNMDAAFQKFFIRIQT